MFANKLFIAAAIAHLPILYMYSRDMWGRGHYQFFPLLFCAVAWLLYERLSEKSTDRKYSLIATGLLILNLAFLFFTIAIYTPVLVIPTVALLLAGFILSHYGFSGLWLTLPVLAVLFIVCKMPTGRDLVLISQMQALASQLASWILDSFRLVHFREGVILITEKKQFFTEEACSGIRSLFSAFAAIALLGLSRRYSAPRQIFNLMQCIVWVIAGNAIRVAAVVYLSDNGYEQFSHGTLHEMFGLVIFLGIVGITLSVDRFLELFRRQATIEDDTDDDVDGTVIDSGVSKSKHPEISKRSETINWILTGAYVLVFLFSSSLMYAKSKGVGRVGFDSLELSSLDASELFGSIAGWTVTNFEEKLRTEASLFAPESFIWSLSKGPLKVIVSLDGPYEEFHDLTLCYRGIGWDVNSNHEYAEDKSSQDGLSWLEMAKPGEFGHVYFSAHASDGQLAHPANEFSARVRFFKNIQLGLGLSAPLTGNLNRNGEPMPISQIQLMLVSDKPITPEELQDARQLFEFCRKKLVTSKRFSQQ